MLLISRSISQSLGFPDKQESTLFQFLYFKAAQKHVEKTLKEMMDQKNKLAYENGRLQTQVEQMSAEVEGLRKADLECTQYKQLAEALQSKYSQVILAFQEQSYLRLHCLHMPFDVTV